jgi:allantoinase
VVASDHSPTEPALKAVEFWCAWGGIAGVQSTLAVLLERGHHARKLPLERIVSLLASRPAERFGIRGKGDLSPGYEADILLLDPAESYTLQAGDLCQRHSMSPYVGASFRGKVRRTIRRGQTIFVDGRITAQRGGRLVRPKR